MLYPGVHETNLTATVRNGTTLTANASPNTEAAAWTIVVPVTDAASDGFWARVCGLSVTATDTGCFVDFAYGDPTTGTNPVEIVSDWSVGDASATGTSAALGRVQFHPQAIPANKSLLARIRAVIASDTAEVAVMLPQSQTNLDSVGAATTFGTSTANTRGTSVTPASGAFGTWTEIGTLASDLNLFFPSLDGLGDTTIVLNAAHQVVEIGHGANSGAVTSIGLWAFSLGNDESIDGPFPPYPVYKPVSSGDKLWARLASGETEARGISIVGSAGTIVSSGGGGGGPRVILPRD